MIEKVYDYMKKTGMSDNTKTIVAGLSRRLQIPYVLLWF